MSTERRIAALEALEFVELCADVAQAALTNAEVVLLRAQHSAEARRVQHKRAEYELELCRRELKRACGIYGFVEELIDDMAHCLPRHGRDQRPTEFPHAS